MSKSRIRKSARSSVRRSVTPPRSDRESLPSMEELHLPPAVIPMIAAGDYLSACELIKVAPRTRELQNVLGVCMLRAGQVVGAVNLFRGLCLMPGTTVIRLEADDITKINYATAILMLGHPSGAESILDEVQDQQQLPVLELRSAIKRWADGLPFWKKWDWRLNRIEPPQSRVSLDHLPGVLPIWVQPRSATESTTRPTGVDPSPQIAA